ncbi:MAG: hypothetical protein R2778_12740 [Saprospiraceae bacterium]
MYCTTAHGTATWDVKDMLFPGIVLTTSQGLTWKDTPLTVMVIIFAVFITNTWNKSLLYVSDDNGTTWTQRVVNDFSY